MSKVTRIGTITNKREIVRRTMEQTACNFYEITVPAYTTAVLYLDTRGDLEWSYEGTCTDESWTNSLFGYSETRKEKPDVGKPMTDWHHGYGYTLLALMLGGDYNILLDEGVEVTAEVKTTHRSEDHPGLLKHTSSSVFARIKPAVPLYSEVVA